MILKYDKKDYQVFSTFLYILLNKFDTNFVLSIHLFFQLHFWNEHWKYTQKTHWKWKKNTIKSSHVKIIFKFVNYINNHTYIKTQSIHTCFLQIFTIIISPYINNILQIFSHFLHQFCIQHLIYLIILFYSIILFFIIYWNMFKYSILLFSLYFGESPTLTFRDGATADSLDFICSYVSWWYVRMVNIYQKQNC